jgi:outer membrane protein OmpA-like peptidoglycan-associated protein
MALPTPSISGGDGSSSGAFCAGKPVSLHATITAPANRTLAYAWTVNGQAQSSTTPDLTITPATGATNVQVTVTDTTPAPAPMERPRKFPERCWVQPPPPAAVAPVTATATVTVSESAPTITSVSASPNTLTACGPDGPKTSNLSGVAQSSACGGNLTYKWTVSEGSVTNDSSPNATFDVSSLTFEQSAQAQSKSVNATLTVTDESGKTATQSTPITVNCTPQFVRLDDAIFAKNNARVNNCAKRLLIDDAASRMANGDYDIILVGHRDTDEETNVRVPGRRGRRGAGEVSLDEQRVLNAAAILSGGTGTCGKVDVSRIKMDFVGTDQTSDPRPGQCGTSNTQERKGSQTSEADKNRRVEIYLVPHGSTVLPPAVKNARPVPEAAVKALGCPH